MNSWSQVLLAELNQLKDEQQALKSLDPIKGLTMLFHEVVLWALRFARHPY